MAKVPEEIRKAWANQNLIPVVGAGVSKGAAGLPNWPGLLTKGIEYAGPKRRTSAALRRRLKHSKPRPAPINC
jgi:hypothetical protein